MADVDLTGPEVPGPGRGRIGAVVLAAGGGTRYGSPKQFATLGGVRLVDRAVALVAEVAEVAEVAAVVVVVVLPAGHRWTGPPVDAAVTGGATRAASMRAGLAALDAVADDITTVIVHDAIRPLADRALLDRLLAALDPGDSGDSGDPGDSGADGVVPVWALPDTLKRLRPDGTLEHVGRAGYVVAQSPAVFRAELLRMAYGVRPYGVGPDRDPVDDASAVEAIGGRVIAIDGDPWSHHVVTPADLVNAEALVHAEAIVAVGRMSHGGTDGAAGTVSRPLDPA